MQAHPPEEGDTEHSIITMLVIDDSGLWSEEEIVREMEGGPLIVEDALARLYAIGMIHHPVEGVRGRYSRGEVRLRARAPVAKAATCLGLREASMASTSGSSP